MRSRTPRDPHGRDPGPCTTLCPGRHPTPERGKCVAAALAAPVPSGVSQPLPPGQVRCASEVAPSPPPVEPPAPGVPLASLREIPVSAPVHLLLLARSFAWPDGTPVFDGLDLLVGPGPHRPGRPQRLRQVDPAAAASPGSCARPRARSASRGEVGYLPQDLTLDTALRVDERARHRRRSRRACTPSRRGDATRTHFARDRRRLGRRGARPRRAGPARARPTSVLDRRLGELSGGEVDPARAGRAAAAPPRRPAAGRADQQPRPGRARAAVRRGRRPGPGSLLVVSHDRELLELVDQIAELRGGRGAAGTAATGRRTRSSVAAEQEAARAGRARRRVRRTPAEARPGRRAGQVWRAPQVAGGRARVRHARREPKIVMERASARRRSRRASTAACTPSGSATPATGSTAAEARVPRRRRDPGRPAGHRGPAGPGRAHHATGLRAAHRRAVVDLDVRGPGADRADRAERRGQDDAAAHDRRAPGRPPPGGCDVHVPLAPPAAAAGRPRRRADRGSRTSRARCAGRRPTSRPRAARPVPVPGRAGRPAGRRRSPAANASGRRWRRCCWPSRRRSCCCSTSRPTTSTWPRARSCRRAGVVPGRAASASHDVPFLESIGTDRFIELGRS